MKRNIKSNIGSFRTFTMVAASAILLVAPNVRAQYNIGERVYTPPPSGNFFSLSHTNFPPLPFPPPFDMPFYFLGPIAGGGGAVAYGYDDSQLCLDELTDTSSLSIVGLSTPLYNGPLFNSNDLWIEILGPTNPVPLALHGTTFGFYQLLSTNSIGKPMQWKFGQYIENTDGTNLMFFQAVPMNGEPQTFYRAVSGRTVASVIVDPYSPNPVIEPNSPTGTTSPGFFDISINPALSNDLTIVFTLTGPAINGTDYTNIATNITIAAGTTRTNVFIQAKYEAKIDFDEPAILTLVLTNGYLVDSNAYKATLVIRDSIDPANLWTLVALTNFPADLDYHSPSNSLIVSANVGNSGQPLNFFRLDTNGVAHAWTGISNLTDEVKIAVVKTTTNGFTKGDMFFSTDEPGVIGWASADGTKWTNKWITLAGETNHLKGGLYVDQTGIWSNNLLAVSGEGDPVLNGTMRIWRIDSHTNAFLITNIATPHLEGPITLPNDVRYGPWAGKLITGDEYAIDGAGASRPLLYAVDTNGLVSSFALGIVPSDIDLIATNQNLYCTDPNYNDSAGGRVLKIPSGYFTNYWGDLLVTDAGEVGLNATGAHYIVHWNSAATNFNVIAIPNPPSSIWSGSFEHSAFAPIDVPPSNP